MRLLTATVRAYRLHLETVVSFDPQRTLIGGPNESGKSTLAEAIHRVLFLKAKGNTAEHRAMKSTAHAGSPEVELTFEARGSVWQLRKRFGSGGDTTLTPRHGLALSGEAAESELAGLLGVEAGASGKLALAQWSHLWVWQGASGDDPCDHASGQRDQLLQRLQEMGGAAAMQSARDARTAAAAAGLRDEVFTAGGKVKAGSALAVAEAALSEAEAAAAAARARAQGLEQSALAFRQAEEDLGRLRGELGLLGRQLEEQQQKAGVIRQRTEEAGVLGAAAAAAQARLEGLERQEAQLGALRTELAALEQDLAPRDAALAALAGRAGAAREAAEARARAFEAASDAAGRARQRQDLAQARVQHWEAARRLGLLRERAAAVEAQQAEMARLALEVAAWPAVDGKALAALQQGESRQRAAEAALRAMAAGVELLSAEGAVTLGGAPLMLGAELILTEEAELQWGAGGRVRVRPGGGSGLAEAREKERVARQEFQAGLAQWGVSSVDEAVAVAAQRSDRQSRILAGQAALQSLNAAGLPAELSAAEAAAAAAQADRARRAAALGEGRGEEAGYPTAGEAPGDGEAARASLAAASREFAEQEASLAGLRAGRDAAQREAGEQAAALAASQESLREGHTRHTGLQANLVYFLEQHGSDAARGVALGEARGQRAEAGAALARVQQVLVELQPEDNERSLVRLQRGLEESQRQRGLVETQLAVAAAALRLDGSQDPVADLAMAEARLGAALEAAQRWRRQAAARALLHEAFVGEQAALAEHFTGPLAEAISGYLECLFGPGTRAKVVLGDQGFSGLELVRPQHLGGGALAFETLSGGTREQAAAAVRLAMAEVLAPLHGGTLPVVFDDAFAYSDAGRLPQLQNMLDLAASRGLQLILLSCAPGDYASLGAVGVSLGGAAAPRPTG